MDRTIPNLGKQTIELDFDFCRISHSILNLVFHLFIVQKIGLVGLQKTKVIFRAKFNKRRFRLVRW